MKKTYEEILHNVSVYYSEKIEQFGETARGVDWNSESSQELRFEKVCTVIRSERPYSINDLGCGYGALVEYLTKEKHQFQYHGLDISETMIEAAKQRYSNSENVNFIRSDTPNHVLDYCVASGVFNVRLGTRHEEWKQYIIKTLEIMNRFSLKGFSFNCLTSYSDADKIRSDLFYADPLELFDYCKSTFSRNVALLHDYDLYEFTIVVRK